MGSNNGARVVGMGFAGWLTILFIGLKLGRVIDWSWWWVLSPLWIPIPIIIAIFFIVFIFSVMWDEIK